MQDLTFKTNIKCGGCVAKVTDELNQTVGEGNWNVNTDKPDKPLTITKDGIQPEQVIAAIQKVGFKAELV